MLIYKKRIKEKVIDYRMRYTTKKLFDNYIIIIIIKYK